MKKYIFITIIFCLVNVNVYANDLTDFDADGVPDYDEINIYYTDANNPDTDNDGFFDWIELNSGYSPHNPIAIKLEDSDYDQDGLSDRMELNFHTNLTNSDTDGDGYKDGDEIKNGYDPLKGDKAKLSKRIEINTGEKQELSYFLGDVRMGTYQVSTGKYRMRTPLGFFKIDSKNRKAWSAKYGLWMPYWMSLQNGYFGIHELPEWPNGFKEGEDHLGKAVSHGCIRLGVGPAEFLYNWAEIETPVFIH
ncbi:MAG: L,D-transpeptidase family protein [Patescibacteria group bacterium]|nr:L,D-transpeptidase family protein [Patescibacteria group bacterium]